MADVVATLKIMPKGPETDLDKIEKEANKKIIDFGGQLAKKEIEPIGFGLKALKIIFFVNEAKGGLDPLEEEVKKIKGVQSAEVVDVRRGLG